MLENQKADVEKIVDLYRQMETDETLGNQFMRDPRAVWQDKGVSEETIDLVLNGTYAQIQDLFQRVENKPVPKIIVRGPHY